MEYLKVFDDPEITFNVIDYDKNAEYNLEIGEEFYYESDDILEKEIIEWANENGYLEESAGYLDVDGNPDIESIRSILRDHEESYPSASSTPSGRAFQYFEDIEIPQNIDLKIIDGLYAGNDWQGVIGRGLDNLLLLQTFLYQKGSKINFVIF